MYSEKLKIIIDFVNKQNNGTYHPIKEKYLVIKDFIQDNKIYKKGMKEYFPLPKSGFLEKLQDQSIYQENVSLLKEYIGWRVDQGENISQYKSVTFAPDFKSIRIGDCL